MHSKAVATPDAFDVPTFINSRRVGAVQYGIIILCGLMMFLDGFDTQAISYMVPLMAKEWGMPREVLGPIFSSALAGLMVGYLVLSPLSDRFGHRRLIMISTVAFALLTLITVLAAGVTELIALRFTTGIALGAAIPSAVALTTEYSPKRLRATFVLAIYCGFSLGFVAAGAMAAWIIPLHGWRALLWIGAIAPLTLAVFVFIFLPESLDFLVRARAEPERIWRVVRRFDTTLPDRGPRAFTTEAEAKKIQDEISAREGDINSALTSLETQRAGKQSIRDEIIKQLPPALFRRYDAVRGKRGSGIAQTTDGTCKACNMSLPPQLFHRLRREPMIEQCPSCQRLIYFVPPSAQAAESES